MQQDPASAATGQSDEEQAKEQAQRALRRTRELRDVQIELDRVNRLYKRKSPLVCPLLAEYIALMCSCVSQFDRAVADDRQFFSLSLM